MPNAQRIHDIFMDCLFRDEEIVNGQPTSEPVKALGILHPVGFNAERLQSHRAEIHQQLLELSDDFYADAGGGMSFLNMCVDRDGRQWGEHLTMEQLCQLGEAIGRVSYPMPRELWDVLPGGMPYVSIDRSEESEHA